MLCGMQRYTRGSGKNGGRSGPVGLDHRSNAGDRNDLKTQSGTSFFKPQNSQSFTVTPHVLQVRPRTLVLKQERHS